MLRTVPTHMRPEAFFSCWTRKEAYLKARGMGLSLALSQFDVTVAPGESAALLGTREEDQDISRWWLRDLSPGFGYVAASRSGGTSQPSSVLAMARGRECAKISADLQFFINSNLLRVPSTKTKQSMNDNPGLKRTDRLSRKYD